MSSYKGFADCNQRQSRYSMLKIPNWTNYFVPLASTDLTYMSSVDLEPIIDHECF